MKGLLLKDLYMSAKYCRAFLGIVIVFLVVSFFGVNNLFAIIYPTMIASMIPMTLLSYDERDNWAQYSGTMPYTRAQLVSAKYIVGLFYGALSYLISMIASVVRMNLQGNFSLINLMSISTALLVLGLLGPTLLLPFVFKLGAEKGRIAFYVMIGIICAGSVAAGIGAQTALPVTGLWVLGVISAFITILYILSWRLSILFYQKREL